MYQSPPQSQQPFSSLGNSSGPSLSGMGIDNNNNQQLIPDAQRNPMVVPGGNSGTVDRSPPGAWGSFPTNSSLSPASPEASVATGGALSGMRAEGRAPQGVDQAPGLSLGGNSGGGGSSNGGGYQIDRLPGVGPLTGGVHEMGAAAAATSGGNGGDLPRPPQVQPVPAAAPDPGDWTMYTSKENGNRAYWHNAKTNVTVSRRISSRRS